MKSTNRREFITTTAGWTGAALASGLFNCTTSAAVRTGKKSTADTQGERLKLGLASYTFRKFSLDDCLVMTKRLGLSRIVFKDFHLPLDSSPGTIQAVAAKVKAAGLDLYGCGVVYMKNEREIHQAFDYARAAGMRMIIGAPEPSLLPLVNQKVKETDLILAIHNHGPGDERYPTAEGAYELIKKLDRRIGLCLDIGHTMRLGVDPCETAVKVADRLYDVHIKDVSRATKEGDTIEIGRGVIDIPRFVQTLLKLKYSGVAAFEFEKDAQDPLPGLAESVGYVRGVLAML